MNGTKLSPARAKQILADAKKARILVVGDVMLDQFIWGGVSRISPEAPVPVVEFSRESFMPGGAANVARNLVALETPATFAISRMSIDVTHLSENLIFTNDVRDSPQR